MSDPVIVSAVRTPIDAFGGYGVSVHAADLGAIGFAVFAVNGGLEM